MKAVISRSPGQLAVETVPDPAPSPGNLILRVAACGICGTDLHLHQAKILPPGAITGHEFCGEVMETAGGFQAGERVCALPARSCGRCERCRSGLGAYCQNQRTLGLGDAPGAYAELVEIAPHDAVRLPASVEDAQGALVEPLAVGLHAVNVARIRAGESVLVIGAGPIGLAIALWARHYGADPVVVSERSAGRRAMAERIGASHVANPETEDLGATLERIVPTGPDAVFEAVGVPGLLQEALSRVRFRGRLVVAGVCMVPDTMEPFPAILKEASIHFVMAYEKDDFQYTVDMLEQQRIAPLPLITNRIGLEEVAQTFESLAKPSEQCKVLVLPQLG